MLISILSKADTRLSLSSAPTSTQADVGADAADVTDFYILNFL